jgi:hypothetical protein
MWSLTLLRSIHGEENTPETFYTQSSLWFHLVLFMALVGFVRTTLDVGRKFVSMIRSAPRVAADSVVAAVYAEIGVGTSDGSSVMEPSTARSAGSGDAGQTTMRFTTVTRQAPIWHSLGGEKYHCRRDCRSLKNAQGVKQKTECLICGNGSVSSTTTRPADWDM